ncbi:hypothetical protein [Leptospira wolffii]|uniref:hypothetical protein n=1 Tax=Leptospira wolffii TaxID=409998 RepID=UPI0002DDD364|nr:hypothetical protein [Leptospira wolffii]EPG67538.1 hypothetical protein LEP1GSC061_0317 [Leptospira wolffii serovar Khorat str. Khorat-H2]
MEEDPKNTGRLPEGEEGDLQEELKFFLENRLNGLLEEAEKFRNFRTGLKTRSRFRRKEENSEKNQGYLPFIYPIPPVREGNSAEPGSKAAGEEG